MDDDRKSFRSDLFAGKRVLISGATSGLGLEVARGFAGLGADVTPQAVRKASSPHALPTRAISAFPSNRLMSAIPPRYRRWLGVSIVSKCS
jgi:short-subunit dehydrogenase